MKYGTIIVGGGASGLLSAILLAGRGESVIVFEANAMVGKKLSTTGNGRCNFTNKQMGSEFYYCTQSTFVEDILGSTPTEDTLALFLKLGIIAKEKEGYYYPFSNQAATVVAIFQSHCKRLSIPICTDEPVISIQHNNSFQVVTAKGSYQSDYVMVATGGKASPSLGGSEDGYGFARSFGHKIAPVFPALTGLVLEGKEWDKFGGIRSWGTISLVVEDQLATGSGELQFTKDGISGIPVFQVSRMAAKGLLNNKVIKGSIDFMPDMELEELIIFLQTNDLRGVLKKKAIGPVLARCHNSKPEEIGRVLKNFTFTVKDTWGFDRAQVTGGGVAIDEIVSTTMESKRQKGLYLVGELLDVDGQCGGYNLQWAWSTAMVACKSIIENRRTN